MDSDDVQYLAVRFNPDRKLLRIVWRPTGDQADHTRLFEMK